MKSTSRPSLATKVIYSVVLALIIYLALSVWASSQGLGEAAQIFNWKFFPAVILLALINYFFRFLKWQFYLKVLAIDIPRMDSLVIFLSGLSLSITPGKLGEVVKSYFLKKRFNEPVSKTAPIVFADRLTDLIALIFLTSVGVLGYAYGQRVVWSVGLIILLILTVIVYRPLGERILSFLGRLSIISQYSTSLREIYDTSYSLLQPRVTLVALPISVVAWGLEGLGLYLIFLGFGLENGFLAALFVYAFSTVLGAASFLPGGLGVAEGTITGLLKLLNIPTGIAVLATLLIRAATLWFAVAIGTVFLLTAERRYRVNVNEIT